MFEEWQRKDPIDRLESSMQEQGIMKPDDAARVREAVVLEVNEAVEWAEQSPYPDPDDALKGVYLEN
jgi:pyruvate dehydrogenase E1 component alpha subunit